MNYNLRHLFANSIASTKVESVKPTSSKADFLVTLSVVNILHPYSTGIANFNLEADLHISDSKIQIIYTLTDETNIFKKPLISKLWNSKQIDFTMGLWNHTCFEAFLKPVAMDRYYEFNFALSPAWMAFQFDQYRLPQPPVPATDFQIQSMNWDHVQNQLTIEVTNKTPYKNFHVGLTAVLEEKTGVKHYCALAHKGLKADFHLAESFTLLRG